MSDHHQIRLIEERARAVSSLARLEGDFDAVVEASQAVSTDDEHDPEGATIGYERAQVDALIQMTKAAIVELDLALQRIREGSYATCANCGGPIGEERLEARPATTTCIACASTRRL